MVGEHGLMSRGGLLVCLLMRLLSLLSLLKLLLALLSGRLGLSLSLLGGDLRVSLRHERLCSLLPLGRRCRGTAAVVKPSPDAREERLLASELHPRTFVIVRRPQDRELVTDVLRALPAAVHVIVKDVERLGRVGERLDGGGEEPSGAVAAVAVTARDAGEARGQALSLSEAVGLGEDARLHLGEQVEGEAGGVLLVVREDERILEALRSCAAALRGGSASRAPLVAATARSGSAALGSWPSLT
mmetsp:Transcript_27782/g.51713  ORF Transcript_27782/g.51713 Transcript_27782/m.51713 type:complete len:244 (-) Transcript_27782:1917-2648(-)